MTNHEINEKFGILVKTERKITLEILHLINLVEDRKIHLELGFANLYDWLIKGHKYSERAAHRRIQAAKLLRSVPVISEKLGEGTVNLTTLAKTQSVIRAQERVSGQIVSNAKKAEIIEKIENQSALKTEQILVEIFPETASQVRRKRLTVINKNVQRLSVNLPNEVIADLNRATELLSHSIPSGQIADVLAHILKEFVVRKDPLKKKTGAALAHRTTRPQVIRNAEGCCTFQDPITGRICGGRFQIERDHIIPLALGGDDSPENSKALCRKHNQLMAEKALGRDKANRWRHEHWQRI